MATASANEAEAPADNGRTVETLEARAGAAAQRPPGRPGGLKTTVIGSRQIDLTWNAVSGAVHYRIYVDNQLVGRSALAFFSVTGLSPDTEYEFEVSAVDAAGAEGQRSKDEEEETDDDNSKIDGTAPTIPSGLVAAVSANRIDLTWVPSTDPESGVSEYRVFRDGILYARPSSPAFSDAGLAVGVTHTYHVAAVNGSGKTSAVSGPVTGTTSGADTSPPTAPSGLQASAVDTAQVTLTWSAATDPQSGISNYVVYRDGSRVGTPSGTSFTDTGLAPATSYSYRVSAVNGAGLEGSASGPLAVTTRAGGDASPPTAPAGLAAAAVDTSSVVLTWSAASDPESGISNYAVYRDGTRVASPAGTSYTDSGLAPGTSYDFRVTAVNGAGLEGPPSATVTVTTPSRTDTSPPSVPGGLAATSPAPDRVQLTWSASTDAESGVSIYNVYRDGALVTGITTTSFLDAGLTASTTYSYTVSAVNGAGIESARSAPASVTTGAAGDATPPTVPTGLEASATASDRVELSWGASSDPESGVAAYNIFRDGTRVASSTSPRYVDPGLSGSTTYTYEVSAVNGDGVESGRSAPASATTPAPVDRTPPSAPTRLRVIGS